MPRISTHVLDIALGEPGRALEVVLRGAEADGIWRELAVERTDEDGRIRDWTGVTELPAGRYSLCYHCSEYFAGRGQRTLYPEIVVEFVVDAKSHYHMPLLLSPYGYTTYRGT